MPATDANRENVVGQPPSADGTRKPGTFSSFWFLKKLSFSPVLSDPKNVRKNGFAFCAENFANGLRIKKVRFTHFGKLNLLLLRKTQNHFYWLFGLLEALFSAEN